MKYSVLLYSGEYKIIENGSSKYLCCVTEKNKIQSFPNKEISKDLLDEIHKLNLANENEILDFVNKWGVLVNTQNKEKRQTYCGIPIALKNADQVVVQKRGACMPLLLFKQQMEVIKNILQLTAYIDAQKNCEIYTSPGCKSQYLNVQKTENKNVHYPLLFRLTF